MPFRLANGPHRWNRTPAPLLGEHNHLVLSTIAGLSEEQIARLADAGVIGDRPRGARATAGARSAR